MPIISFLNQKGGCGKTSAALHFSYWLSRKKKTVQVVDADPQCSLSKWLTAINSPITVTSLTTPDDLLEQIPVLAEKPDFLIVDAPPGLAESSRAILFATDVAIVPIQPTGLDLDASAEAIRLIKQAQKVRGGLPKTAIFLNRTTKRSRLKEEAILLIQQIPAVTLLKTTIHQRQAIADAFGQGGTVFDLKISGANDAALEFDDLFKEIIRLLK